MAKPILVTVDDDPEVLRAVSRDLKRRYGGQYRILQADSGATALELSRKLKLRNEPVALFLADQRMPHLSGTEFLMQAAEIFPEAKRILLTAYADTDAAIQAINQARVDYYLLKPWHPPEEKLFPILDEFEDAIRDLPEAVLQPALQWLDADLASRQLLNDVTEASQRIADLVAAVKSYSHMDRAPAMSEIDIHEGIQTTLTILAHKLRSKDVVLKQAFDPKLPQVKGNPGELNQVWTNLIDNAIDAVPLGGEIIIRTSSTEVEVLVQVIDNGAGIPSEIQWRIFEPFFTTKEVGQGTGLGLDVVQRIVQAHQADVRVDSSPGRTCFEVRLPVYHHQS